MFGFFKRKATASISSQLHFKSAEDAFEYCCRYMNCRLAENVILPALVLDAVKEFGTSTAVKVGDDGVQTACFYRVMKVHSW